MRINKYLAECGICSRRNADEYVKQGRVSVNKKKVTELGTDVDEDNDTVFVDGKKVVHITHYDYLMFNKPKGCVTTLDDSRDIKNGRPKDDNDENESSRPKFGADKREAGKFTANDKPDGADSAQANEDKKPRKTVMDFIGGEYASKRLYPVGRLDYDSEGLLLLTNDGNLTYALTHPSQEVPKTYIVKIEGTIQESDLAILRKGATLNGVKFGHAKVKVTGTENGLTRLEVIIFEGKNREIRRMFEAVEKNVVFLKRVAIGDLRLGGLSRGGYRELNETEVAYLKKLGTKIEKVVKA